MPCWSTNRSTSSQTEAASTTTAKVVEALATLPALSRAVALSVFAPRNDVAGPDAPGHVLEARPEVASLVLHVIAIVSVTS